MEQKFKPDADTINALMDGMGAIVFALVRQLSPEQKKSFLKDLDFLSKRQTASGNTTAGTVILDLASAAEIAARQD